MRADEVDEEDLELVDPWYGLIRLWAFERNMRPFTLIEVLRDCLKLPPMKMTVEQGQQVDRLLRRLGFERKQGAYHYP